jgi:hypothetical protein
VPTSAWRSPERPMRNCPGIDAQYIAHLGWGV